MLPGEETKRYWERKRYGFPDKVIDCLDLIKAQNLNASEWNGLLEQVKEFAREKTIEEWMETLRQYYTFDKEFEKFDIFRVKKDARGRACVIFETVEGWTLTVCYSRHFDECVELKFDDDDWSRVSREGMIKHWEGEDRFGIRAKHDKTLQKLADALYK